MGKKRTVYLDGFVFQKMKDNKSLIFKSDAGGWHRVEAREDLIKNLEVGQYGVMQILNIASDEIPLVVEASSINRKRKERARL
jgi:hypothetical protein